ncbi:hypothetical protein L6452_16598 [Arctium lappa]|uniref:Uncharacterized protein n=1 Tax=Arctium lappa TaxID=4217 RepID=A0ACB9C1A6_ARCLA|nr:hypothetical protein L6452_16598 [Arctium lappa]
MGHWKISNEPSSATQLSLSAVTYSADRRYQLKVEALNGLFGTSLTPYPGFTPAVMYIRFTNIFLSSIAV